MRPLRAALERPAIRSAIRITLAIVVGDILLLTTFGESSATTLGSFAIVILLLLLDFEGSARERFLSYLAASAIGAVVAAVGIVISPIPWLGIALTVPVMFAFAFARVLKGFIARSAVGLPLAFFLPILSDVRITEFWPMITGWLFGCTVATAFAMLVLPRHSSGLLRRALAAWCTASAELVSAMQHGSDLAAPQQALSDAYRQIRDLLTRGTARPGALSHRLRALLQLANVATTAEYVAREFRSGVGPRHPDLLAPPSIAAFTAAERFVSLDARTAPVTDLVQTRAADVTAAATWAAASLEESGSIAAIGELRAHYPLRLASISATTTQWLAAASAGRTIAPPDIGFIQTTTPSELIRGNLTFTSPWFRNALRTAFAAAVAVAVADLLGLAHGFWVVMATLSLIQTTFSASTSNQRAWRDALGAVLAVVLGALLVYVAPSAWMFAVVLAASAFTAKVLPGNRPVLSQFVFSLFVIANVTLLTWPPSELTAEYRLIDVVIGSLVAIALTFVIFPRGVGRLIDETRGTASALVDRYVVACRRGLADPAPDLAGIAALRESCVRAIVRFTDAVDAGFMAQSGSSAEIASLEASEALMRDSLLAGDAMVSLTHLGERPADIPGLGATIGGPAAAMAQVVDREKPEIVRHPLALVSAVWATWWLDYLASARRGLTRSTGSTAA